MASEPSELIGRPARLGGLGDWIDVIRDRRLVLRRPRRSLSLTSAVVATVLLGVTPAVVVSGVLVARHAGATAVRGDLILMGAATAAALAAAAWVGIRFIAHPYRSAAAQVMAHASEDAVVPRRRGLRAEVRALAIAWEDVVAGARADREAAASATGLATRLERERAELAAQIETLADHQRLVAAPALHDDVIQRVTSISYRLARLRRAAVDEATRDELERVEADAQSAVERLRLLLSDLGPAVDQAPASRSLADELDRCLAGVSLFDAALSVTLDVQTADEPAGAVRDLLVRVVREALVNVQRHADASMVRVVVREVAGGFHARVRDDGRGCDPDLAMGVQAGPLGLYQLRTRVDAVGGWLRISSRPGEGTTLEAWLPPVPVPTEPSPTPTRLPAPV